MTTPDEHMLSTSDNPYNPYTKFVEWYEWDTRAGYHTLNFLDRMTRTSDELPDSLQSQAIEQAIDEIVSLNITGNYIKVPQPASPNVPDN